MPAEKWDIDASLIRELVAEQFPHWAGLAIRPVELSGWDNKTFHLGEGMSVRIPSAEMYTAQAEKEQQWLPKLAPPTSRRCRLGVPDASNWVVVRSKHS